MSTTMCFEQSIQTFWRIKVNRSTACIASILDLRNWNDFLLHLWLTKNERPTLKNKAQKNP